MATDVPIKYPYIGGTKWAFLKWADIPDASNDKRVYLRRLRIVQTPLFALYLHFIYLKDEDRDPHDHPFNFWSLILRGGYTERVWRIAPGIDRDRLHFTQTWGRFSFHKMSMRESHMIDTLKPHTTTLVFCGRKVKSWGFYPETGYVPYQQYVTEKFAHSDDALA